MGGTIENREACEGKGIVHYGSTSRFNVQRSTLKGITQVAVNAPFSPNKIVDLPT